MIQNKMIFKLKKRKRNKDKDQDQDNNIEDDNIKSKYSKISTKKIIKNKRQLKKKMTIMDIYQIKKQKKKIMLNIKIKV